MQSSYQPTSSPQHRSGSSFVFTTNGQQSTAKVFSKQIQAQSSSSIDMLSKQKQQLIMKLLMMSFQIQRKDVVVKNLLKQLEQISTRNSLSSNEQFYTLQQQLSKSKRYSEDLQFKLNQVELTNKQLSVNQRSTSRELQQRIVFLQTKNKELQLRKIQLESQYQKIVTQYKMLNFKLANTQTAAKGKGLQSQNQIVNLHKKIDQQKKICTQLKIIIDSSHQEIRVLKENQQHMIKQFQQRMKSLENQLHHRQDLKRSQAVNSQQKIQMTQQQLIRMQQEIKFLRKKLDDQQLSYERKQQQLIGDLKRAKDIEAELFHSRHQITVFKGQLQQKNVHLNNLVRQLNEAKNAYHHLQKSKQMSEIQHTQTIQQRMYLVQQQVQNYRQKMISLQNQLDHFKTENRKLKRKTNSGSTECMSCKILQSATSIKSIKVINDINLSEIIEQTQKLHNSSLKIEQLLSSRRISIGGYESRVSIDKSFVYEEY